MNKFVLSSILSDLAYQDKARIEAELNNMGLEHFVFIENLCNDTQCFICSDDEFVFVVFRGTSNFEDAKTDLKIFFETCPFGRIHAGFWDSAKSVSIKVFCELIKHIVARRKLVLTGHSLGGGVANSMAIKMLSEHRDIDSVPTFGCPRTVDLVAANHIDTYFPDIFHRFVNNNDIVTRIPPRMFGYKHFGNLHYFEEDGSYTNDISAWERFLDRIKGKVGDFGDAGFDCMKDHCLDYTRLVGRVF